MSNAAENKVVRVVSATRMHLSESTHQNYDVFVESDTTKEDLLNSDTWALVAAKLRPLDKLHVSPDDGQFFAELLVQACGRTWAKVHLLHYHDLSPVRIAELSLLEEYTIKHRGPQLKWSIVRKKDRAIIREGMDTEDEAQTYLREFNNQLKR